MDNQRGYSPLFVCIVVDIDHKGEHARMAIPLDRILVIIESEDAEAPVALQLVGAKALVFILEPFDAAVARYHRLLEDAARKGSYGPD